ncbi:MAG: hypothetical protein HYV63_25640 [Candidatus Schekmanbacteria bacterium]|nr:hypothetical protein [Candidatus Schekmanbacteria bacterium]
MRLLDRTAIHVLGLLAALAIGAEGINHWLFAETAPDIPEPAAETPVVAAAARQAGAETMLAELRRIDPFRLGPPPAAPEELEPTIGAEEVAEIDGLRLVGTAATPGPGGVAVFEKTGTLIAEVAGLQDTVGGAWTVVSIQARWVVLSQGTRRVRLTLAANEKAAPLQIAAAVPQQAPLPNDPTDTAIEELGPGRYRLDRNVVQQKVNDLASLSHEIAVAARPGDRGGGFIVKRLSGDSVFRKIGLQRGDVLLRANGRDISQPMELFALLRNATSLRHVTLEIDRNGTTNTLSYELR